MVFFADAFYAFLGLFWIGYTAFCWFGCLESYFPLERIADNQFWTISEMSCHLAHVLVQVKDAIFKTLIANGMFDNAHIRLTLTRGKKVNTEQDSWWCSFNSICYLSPSRHKPLAQHPCVREKNCLLILFTGCVFSSEGDIWNESSFQSLWVRADWYSSFCPPFSLCIHVHLFSFASWVHLWTLKEKLK